MSSIPIILVDHKSDGLLKNQSLFQVCSFYVNTWMI